MTCIPASTQVSISIYTLELEKKSSVAVTFTLFVNARLTFSPLKYPYSALRRPLLYSRYPNVEKIYINVSVPFILKKRPIAICSVSSLTNYLDILLNDRNCNIQSNNQPSTIKVALMKNHQEQTNNHPPRLAFYRYRLGWFTTFLAFWYVVGQYEG